MNYTLMTFLGFMFIFVMTTAGAGLVLFFRGNISARVSSVFLSFASGIMVASSVWSLIMPAIEGSSSWGTWAFVPAVIGIILGCAFLVLLERLMRKKETDSLERLRCAKLFLAVTIHNIPEGLAVGFAFGAAFTAGTDSAYVLAMGLAFGIGIQNFPEGTAVALPVKGATGSRARGFFMGTLSGVVEPIFALVGYFLAAYLVYLQPWLLAFSAGAMIFVVLTDLMRDAYEDVNALVPSIGFVSGFLIMMILDVALG